MCICLDENEEYKIIENSFYDMYIYNEYVLDIMQTNKLRHLKNILSDRGFNILEHEEADIILNKETTELSKELKLEYKEQLFTEYLQYLKDEQDKRNKEDEQEDEPKTMTILLLINSKI